MTAVPTVAIIACLQLPHGALALIIIGVTFDATELIAVNQLNLCTMATNSLTGRFYRCGNQSMAFKLQIANLREYDGMIRVGWEPLKWQTRHVARKHTLEYTWCSGNVCTARK